MEIAAMKKVLLCLLLAVCALPGADFSYSLIGKFSAKNSASPATALTDGALKYNTAHIIWDSVNAPKGCGFIINFAKPTAISKVAVVTAKPNGSPFLPERTEFTLWNDEQHIWGEATVVKDITGRCADTKFSTAEPVVTEWKGSATVSAVKVVMYGASLWCTEVQVFDAEGKMLQGRGWPESAAGAERLTCADGGCCPSINLAHYKKNGEYVGFPNTLPRKDRVIFSYDVRKYLMQGSVKRALLKVVCAPMGRVEAHRLSLSAFTDEHWPLRPMDIIAGDVTTVAEMLFDRQGDGIYYLDVTELLNEALKRGDGYLGFRLASLTAEKCGNRNSAIEGVYLKLKQTVLEIEK
jgi:hypothetical protein